ncbi:MAG: VOC family protein [Bacteroidales bacterium]|jgi:methylmalonyl-CoA/ethylmalonyl-CoA epimerase|nr:VOC family protein [Bacteroidales bacterium]
MLSYFKFHHIGIAVFDIDSTAKYYISAGYSKTNTVYDPVQNVYISFLTKDGMPKIELLAPKDETSPVNKILKKNGVMPYHFCYEVDEINQAIADLKKLHFVLINMPVRALAIENKKICFLFNKDVGLIELLEE